MFLFVKVEEEKSEGIACLPAQSCTLNAGGLVSPSPNPNCFLSTQACIFINFSLPEKRKTFLSAGVDSTLLNNWTSISLHYEAYRTIYLDKGHGCSGIELLRCVAAHCQHCSNRGLKGAMQSATVLAMPLTRPIEHKTKWKTVASRWLLCYK